MPRRTIRYARSRQNLEEQNFLAERSPWLADAVYGLNPVEGHLH